MKYKSSSQAFKFDILTIMKFIKIIDKNNDTDTTKISSETGMGLPKINEFLQYMRFCDILHNGTLSRFGSGLLEMGKKPDKIESLLLYKLSRGCSNGGHYYFSRLINQVLYDYAFQINNIAPRKQILEKSLLCDVEKEYSKDNPQNKETNFIMALNQGLCDTTTGFGDRKSVV